MKGRNFTDDILLQFKKLLQILNEEFEAMTLWKSQNEGNSMEENLGPGDHVYP